MKTQKKVLLTPHVEHYIKGITSYMPKNILIMQLTQSIKKEVNLNERKSTQNFIQSIANQFGKHSIPSLFAYKLFSAVQDIDLIHANTSTIARLMTKTGLPVLVTEHGYPNPQIEDAASIKEAEKEAESMIQLAENGIPIVTISQYSAEMLKKMYNVKVKKVIYHGVLPIFNNKKILEGKTVNKPRVLWVSRMIPMKKPLTFIKAINLLQKSKQPVTGLMRGEGSLKNLVTKLIQSNKRIQIIPRIPFYKLPGIFHTSHIYVHTAPTEPFGLTILEAMASSLPIIVPSTGGADEVAGYAGLRFEKDDEKDLSEKIRMLIDDREEYIRQSELSQRRSREFSWGTAAKEYYEIYQKY